MRRDAINLTGQRFGAWTVLRFTERSGGATWLCRCDCGAEKEIRSIDLRKGKTSRCRACFEAEHVRRLSTGETITEAAGRLGFTRMSFVSRIRDMGEARALVAPKNKRRRTPPRERVLEAARALVADADDRKNWERLRHAARAWLAAADSPSLPSE